jgi:hypothetical protein
MPVTLIGLIVISLLVSTAQSGVLPLPALRDGSVITGPGSFRQDEKLTIEGHVSLRNLTLELRAPVRLASGATLELSDVHIVLSDPPGSANGSSNLICDGPAHVVIHNSTMHPSESAHPIWGLKGELEVDGFETTNSEFHLDHVRAQIDRLNIFELEISRASEVLAKHLNLVFLSTHTGDDDHLQFSDIPTEQTFSKELALGSGAKASLSDTRLHIFLLYVHGSSSATLSRMARVQLAIFPDCRGNLRLRHGKVGNELTPVIFPEPGASDCPFRISLRDVNLDTWDVYSSGHADLTFDHSLIDELTATDHAKLTVRNSDLYADWLAASRDAELTIEDSTVGALRLASQRPDLATSEARLTGRSHARFSNVRFDCGIFATDQARVEIDRALTPPLYVHQTGQAKFTLSKNGRRP